MVFYRRTSAEQVLLGVYVYDIVIPGDDRQGIAKLKKFLDEQFQAKDMGALKYYLDIDVIQDEQDIVTS